MWCVADLTDEYLENMEEVLEIYERPYNPSEPVVCLDEKPVSLHDDVREARPMRRIYARAEEIAVAAAQG